MTNLKAILFDLDGTLLDSNMHAFLPHYLQHFAGRVAHLIPPKAFIAHLLAATQAIVTMTAEIPTRRSSPRHSTRASASAGELKPIFTDFTRDYPELQA